MTLILYKIKPAGKLILTHVNRSLTMLKNKDLDSESPGKPKDSIRRQQFIKLTEKN